MLNIISGLVIPSEGRLLFDDIDVTHLPAKERNIAQVFQFPVIYDTMTVAENLAFPLKNRRLPRAAIERRVTEIAAMPDLTGVLNRRARGLTADAKQKISLRRGLVRSDVSAVLFDEPLTVIGPALKWERRSKLKAVHRALDLLMIYVTHDQIEALTFADQVVVMNEGKAFKSAALVVIGVADADPMERREHDLADIRAAGHWSVRDRSQTVSAFTTIVTEDAVSAWITIVVIDARHWTAAGHLLSYAPSQGGPGSPSIRLPESTARADWAIFFESNCPSRKRFSSLPCCCASCRRS